MPLEPEIRITGAKVRVQQGKKKLADIPVEQLIDSIYGGCERACRFEIRPRNARIWEMRGNAVAAGHHVHPPKELLPQIHTSVQWF